jgi:hypothetical protein
MAFYDPYAQGQAAARAYLITTEQFVDVLAQETRRSPGMSLDLAPSFRGDRYSRVSAATRFWSGLVSVEECRS